MKKEKEFRIECCCGHKGHFFTIGEWIDEDDNLWAAICEADRGLPFWTRLNYAIGYLFGRHNLNYLEIILKKEDIKKLGEFINNKLKK